MPPRKKATSKNKNRAKETASAKPKAKNKASGGKGKAWTFPKNSLEESIQVAKAIDEKHAGNPMRAQDLAKALGFNQPKDWRFLDILRSANQYKLVSGSGANAIVKLETTGEQIVAPVSSTQRQEALLSAFRNVDQFQNVEGFYSGKQIPEDEFFENTLTRDFKIDRERVKAFIDVFKSNLEYLNLFHARRRVEAVGEVGSNVDQPSEAVAYTTSPERVREFLDTCFVMMPFGEWHDKYYQQIYMPAIRKAGFEPVRADDLFSTGTVVEQIWEQIQKSTVLLADLSDKNANVFYELGLAHAAKKPVVFTASSTNDIPFDLQHLRVIPYDVREPSWNESLSTQVTEYLKNAREEPQKSIPQPFRNSDDNFGEE